MVLQSFVDRPRRTANEDSLGWRLAAVRIAVSVGLLVPSRLLADELEDFLDGLHGDAGLADVCSVEAVDAIGPEDTALEPEHLLVALALPGEKSELGLDGFDGVHEKLNFLEVVAVGFAVEVEPNVLNVFPWFSIE